MNQPAIAVIFTNTSATPCTMYGYPGVTGLDAHGHQIAQAYRTPQVYMGGAPSGFPTQVTVASGAHASALIGGTAQPVNGQTTCAADYAAVSSHHPARVRRPNCPSISHRVPALPSPPWSPALPAACSSSKPALGRQD